MIFDLDTLEIDPGKRNIMEELFTFNESCKLSFLRSGNPEEYINLDAPLTK